MATIKLHPIICYYGGKGGEIVTVNTSENEATMTLTVHGPIFEIEVRGLKIPKKCFSPVYAVTKD
jgi:hypothetical protein